MRVYSLSFFRCRSSGYETALAGASQGTFFTDFLPTALRAFYAIYPDWQLRIHHDDRVTLLPYWNVLEKLAAMDKLRLVYCGQADLLCKSMLWRCLPFWDPEVDVFACRDIDSLPQPRERIMLEEFCASDKSIHAMLDSESHCGPLMGGMCAFKPQPPAADFGAWLADHPLGQHGSDQWFLNAVFPDHTRMLIHQRRELVSYPAAETRMAAPCVEDGDQIVHCGAAYPLEQVRPLYPNELLDELEASCT